MVSRPGKGCEPWYLLTNEPIRSLDDAWQIVFAYARRWQLETTFRYSKTELAMESPPPLVLGQPPQTHVDGHPRLCFLVVTPISASIGCVLVLG